jgi:hypothetical protein
MKDSDTTYLICLLFLFLGMAADLAAAVRNISLAALGAFEVLFCVPCAIALLALANAWESMGE